MKNYFHFAILSVVSTLLSLMSVSQSSAQVYTGELAPGDTTYTDGEYFDTYTFQLQAGQRMDVRLSSSVFDTYLIVRSPSGEAVVNDDLNGNERVSALEVPISETGQWEVVATSYKGGETGRYELTVNLGAVAPVNNGARMERGVLDATDRTLTSGEFVDYYDFQGVQGERVTIDLRSSQFDPYLIFKFPNGEQLDNDDFEGDATRSVISTVLPQTGAYEILVTSYQPGLVGSYDMQVTRGGQPAPPQPVQPPRPEPQRVERGQLRAGDDTLTSGEYVDTYDIQGVQGEILTIDMQSSEFDPYLILKLPNDLQIENDDFQRDPSRSVVSVTLPQTGAYQIMATSYEPNLSGNYTLSVTRGAGPAIGPANGQPPVMERGSLVAGDETLESGEYIDRFDFRGQQGEVVMIDMRSTEFDPYLIFVSPDGDSIDNDDFAGDVTRSVIALTLPQTGDYEIIATSLQPNEIGNYQLAVSRSGGGGGGGVVPPQNPTRTEVGRLEPGDVTIGTGEYIDPHSFEGYPGQRVRIDVFSNEFDTYLIVKSPSGEQFENDDVDGSPGHSILELTLSEPGTWAVNVTSYQPGETGNYQLTIGVGDSPIERDVTPIAMNNRVSGELSETDMQLPDGEYQDLYVFDGVAGQPVKVRLEGEFDTYLGIIAPSGESIENDDYEGDTRASQVSIRLPEDGRYRIVTTSYSSGETGQYSLTLADANPNEIADPVANGGGRIYGIFVGISDYGGRIGDLQWTASDAALIRNAFVTGCGMGMNDGVILTDSVATTRELRNAIADISAKITPNDTFVFFFSGHGGQYQRNDRPTNDVDGMDESLEFYDTEILDDELAALLDQINVGNQLIILDSCFSGGFAKDVISRPGRMGLFSSQEGMVSMEASKFRAGGYLAKFFSDAIKGGIADTNGDQALSPNEIEDFIRRMYNEEAVSSSRDIGYQRLRVDSGSINPSAPLLFVR